MSERGVEGIPRDPLNTIFAEQNVLFFRALVFIYLFIYLFIIYLFIYLFIYLVVEFRITRIRNFRITQVMIPFLVGGVVGPPRASTSGKEK